MAESWEASAEEALRPIARRQAAEIEDLKTKLRDAGTREWEQAGRILELEAEVRKLQEELARRDAGVLPFRREGTG